MIGKYERSHSDGGKQVPRLKSHVSRKNARLSMASAVVATWFCQRYSLSGHFRFSSAFATPCINPRSTAVTYRYYCTPNAKLKDSARGRSHHILSSQFICTGPPPPVRRLT